MMEVPGICRCCLSEGLHKDLKSPYVFLDRKEVYSDMLFECFNIFLIPLDQCSNTICDTCIETVRSSWHFKQKVSRVQEDLMRQREKHTSESKPDLDVKLEPKYDSDDSDDYFLADAVRAASIEHIKIEDVEQEKKGFKKKRDASWKSGSINTLVSRLANSIGREFPSTLKTRPAKTKKRTITISKDKPRIIWNSSSKQTSKHMENLQTILKYSNVAPFKTKSLLGYICCYCDSAYPDPDNLRNHTLQDHKKERLKLHVSDKSNFYVNLDINDLTCTLCEGKFENLNGLKTHLVNVHKETVHTDVKDFLFQFKLKAGDVYDCVYCTCTYETFKMLKQHMNKHYSNYQCNKCDSVFATKRSLSSHKTTHQEGSFKCDRCDKVFPSLSKKHYHVKTKHLGTRNISNCPFCNEPFRSYYQRNQHLVKIHNAEAQYKCNVCAKSFVLKSLLMNHIKKNHLMERNAQCTECGYRFFSKKALKAHMVKHTGERNYSCEVCLKTYARKYTLREHMRIHNNDRRFKCEVCGMTFVQKCSLKSHLLSNHGISLAASEISCLENQT